MRKAFFMSLAVGLVVGLVAFVPSAWAGSITRVVAAIGYPVVGGDAGCFAPSYGGIRNNCSSTKSWEIPLVLHGEGSGTLSSDAWLPAGTSATRCQTTSIIGNSWWNSGWQAPWAANGELWMSVYFPSAGNAYITCKIAPGGLVNDVSYHVD